MASASPRHQDRLQSLIAHLPHDQAGFLVIAAVIDDIDVVELELGDERGEILVALIVGLVELLLHARGVERLLHLVGEAFAVGRLVVDDGDVLVLEILRQIAGGKAALLIVAAAGAECVPHAAVGEERIGRGRRDLQHVAVDIGVRGRDRRRRAIMADGNGDAHAGEFFRDRARLLGIAGIVADLEPELSSEHAAGGIDVGDRLLGAVAHLPAEGRLAAGHRARGADHDVVRHRRAGEERRKAAQRRRAVACSCLSPSSCCSGEDVPFG